MLERSTLSCSSTSSGDVVNIIGEWDGSIAGTHAITLSSKENLLIHHPDHLITATTLSRGAVCRRKSLIVDLVRTTTDVRESTVLGHILHEVMQTCLNEDRWDTKFIDDEIEEVSRRKLPELMRIEMSVEQMIEKVKDHAVGLEDFSRRFIGKTPKVCKASIFWFLSGGDGYFSRTRS